MEHIEVTPDDVCEFWHEKAPMEGPHGVVSLPWGPAETNLLCVKLRGREFTLKEGNIWEDVDTGDSVAIDFSRHDFSDYRMTMDD